jgi:hypothetical protein
MAGVRHTSGKKMKEVPKAVKRALRELSAAAHEEELRRALSPLGDAFEAWKAGKVTGGELVEAIHRFHQGPARDLFLKYDRRLSPASVAQAIANGIIRRESVPPEVLDHLAGLLEFYAISEPGS